MRIENLADHPEYVEVVARWQWDEWGTDPTDSLAARIIDLRAQTDPERVPTTYIALDDGGVALGSASLVEDDMRTHPELSPCLASVYVAPAARGRGVASALVRRVVAQTATTGVARLYLYTPDAQGLYAKLGWRVVTTERFEGHPVTIMAIDPGAGHTLPPDR